MAVENTGATARLGRWRQGWALNRQHLRQVLALSKPWFSSDQRWQARGLLFLIVVLNLALVYMSVLFNDWNRLFYDALQEKNQPVFWQQMMRFGWLAAVFVVIAVYKFYLTQVLDIRWRTWMTQHYLERWFYNQAFYRMELTRFSQPGTTANNPDNPDQRIQEDVREFTRLTITLGTGLLNAVVTLLSFVGILWGLSGGFGFHLMGVEYEIAGFMVWMALFYCIAGSVLTHFIGKPQIGLNFEQQQVEAHFRHRMVRVREYSESIALEQGNTNEHGQIGMRFGQVVRNYQALIAAQKRLVWFTSFFGQAAVIFPFLVAAPRFFSGAIHLGELIQIVSAFRQVQEALSWLVDNYQQLATWRATTNRLNGFEAALQSLQEQARAPTSADSMGAADDTAHEVAPPTPGALNLRITLPDGAVLLAQTDLQLSPGHNVLLTGPSGSGKSTLFRTLAGIWPWATGQVQRAENCLFLPQRAYIPEGSLRDALTYPKAPNTWSDAALEQALRDALLPGLADQLDVSAAWSQKLSGGEQQRLAIARALLQQPQWIFADEATSALDPDAEATLYQRLCELVARRGGGLVSIAHRAGIARFHNRLWVLEPQASGSEARFKLHEKPLTQA